MAPHTFDGYSQLPTNVAPPAFWRVQGYASHYSRVAVQYVRNARRSLVLGLIAAFVFLLVVIGVLGGRGAGGGLLDGPPLLGGPPDWSDMWAYEAALPQHNPNLTFPEGASGR